MSKWKLVDDELPPIDEIVLVQCEPSEYTQAGERYTHRTAYVGVLEKEENEDELLWKWASGDLFINHRGQWQSSNIRRIEKSRPMRWCRIPLPPNAANQRI